MADIPSAVAGFAMIIGKDRDPPIRDPLFFSLLSLIKATLRLIDSYSLTMAILVLVSLIKSY